ncbi:hypothetical protein ACGFYQ_41675 [Streptomyces sp. NPDC048258]|uniref:hypothetical protein n=1 Tax=Streptomyces sp. NPDC048258 TaxID=3365527 RepID=UPI003719C1BC
MGRFSRPMALGPGDIERGQPTGRVRLEFGEGTAAEFAHRGRLPFHRLRDGRIRLAWRRDLAVGFKNIPLLTQDVYELDAEWQRRFPSMELREARHQDLRRRPYPCSQ